MSQTDTIVQEIRAEFESMLNYIKDSGTATADQVERGIFKRLLDMGARLMVLFFALRSQAQSRQEYPTPGGQRLPYMGERPRSYFSIFGKLLLTRPYFYRQGVGSAMPLDQELALGEDCYSDLLRELAEYLGVGSTYAKVADCFAHLLGLPLSTQAIRDLVAEDAVDVEAFYSQRPPPSSASEAPILVIQADGKGVPIVRAAPAAPKVRLGKGDKPGRKKEAVVTGLYTIAPYLRTPEEVVASLFHPTSAPSSSSQQERAPHNKRLWATMAGKDIALDRLADQAARREGPHIDSRVALTDGAAALQERIRQRFPTFTLILDFIHADEKLWDVGNALFGETSSQRTSWVESRTLDMLSGRTAQVINELRQYAEAATTKAAQQAVLTQVANYFERNADYMHYDEYLARGWPIASGVIEGACRHLVKDRCELSGMRWTVEGVENLLRLRAVAENGDWADYRRFHQQERHQRLYGVPLPMQDTLEDQALNGLPELSSPAQPGKRFFTVPDIAAPRIGQSLSRLPNERLN
jgi:hypothetical protein